jgi:hypothetical protein
MAATRPDDVDLVVVPDDDPAFEQAAIAALRAVTGEPGAQPDGPSADAVQQRLRWDHPAADVLYEAPATPGSRRARLTVYRDGADAA